MERVVSAWFAYCLTLLLRSDSDFVTTSESCLKHLEKIAVMSSEILVENGLVPLVDNDCYCVHAVGAYLVVVLVLKNVIQNHVQDWSTSTLIVVDDGVEARSTLTRVRVIRSLRSRARNRGEYSCGWNQVV